MDRNRMGRPVMKEMSDADVFGSSSNGEMSDADVFGTPAPAAPAPKEHPGIVGAVVRGFKRSLPETKMLGAAALATAGGALGLDRVRDYGLDVYRNTQKDIVDEQGPSFADVRHGKAGLGEYVGDVVGNFAGQGVQSAVVATAGAALGSEVPGLGNAAGAIGGLIAKGAIKRELGKAVEKQLAAQVLKGTVKEGGEAAARGAIERKLTRQLGAGAAAAYGLNAAQETGTIYGARADDAAQNGEGLNRGDALRAIGFGGVSGAVDTAAETIGIGRLFGGASGSNKIVRRVLAGAGKGALTEGGTEATQAVLERAGAKQSLTDEAARQDYLENFAAGAIGGGVLGAPSGIRRHVTDHPERAQDENAPNPVLRLAAPDGTPGYGAHVVTPQGTVITPDDQSRLGTAFEQDRLNQQRELLNQQGADIQAVRDRSAVGLTPDVNAARAAHPAAAPNSPAEQAPPPAVPPNRAPSRGLNAGMFERQLAEQARARAAALPPLDPGNGPASRVVNEGLQTGAVQDAAEQQALAAAAPIIQAQAQEEAAPAPPPVPWVNAETGEMSDPTDKQLKQFLHDSLNQQASTGVDRKAITRALWDNYGVTPERTGEMWKQVVSERKTGLTAPVESTDAQAQSAAEPAARAAADVGAEGLRQGGEDGGQVATGANRAGSEVARQVALALSGETVNPTQEDPSGTTRQGVLANPSRGQAVPAPAASTNPESSSQTSQTSSDIPPAASATPEAENKSAAQTSTPAGSLPAQAAVAAEPTTLANQAVPSPQDTPAPAEIHAAAHEAATSPQNDLTPPTPAQLEAGNFKVGRIKINGLDISIEHPAGVKRKPEHSRALAQAYGYIRRTEGADGEKVDVFLGDHAADTNKPVFVVDQKKRDGTFDEHKAMLGFDNEADARAAYLANYPRGWEKKGLAGIRQMSQDEFKAWVQNPEATKQPAAPADDAHAHAQALAEWDKEAEKDGLQAAIKHAEAVAAGAFWRKPFNQSRADQRASDPVLRATEEWLDAKRGKTAGDANPVATAIAKIADGTHPERALEGMDAETARAVAAAMGRKFSPKASTIAIAERLGEEARADWIARAQKAVAADAHARKELARRANTSKTEPTPAAQTSEPATPKNTEDAGEELWANRRSVLGKGLQWADIKDLNSALKVVEATKSKVWPRPDYQALIDAGMTAETAHVIKQVYDSLATKPQVRGAPTDEQLRDYIETLGKIRDAAFEWAKRGGFPSDTILDAAFPMPEGNRNRWRNADGKPNDNNARALLVGGERMRKGISIDIRRHMGAAGKAAHAGWPGTQEAWKRLYEFYTGATGHWYVTRARRILARDFATREDAEAFAKAHYEQKKKPTSKPSAEESQSVESAVREGRQWRAPDEDITSDRLQQTFGFKGINFGNWMKGDTPAKRRERQQHLNAAYDSMMDLADLLGVEPKAMSLNGTLGLAFGAQGKGGRAAAHFIPGVNEINITRAHGAGSLAHEWAHALDHYFAVQAGDQSARVTEPFLTHLSLGNRIEAGVRPEIAQAFQKIVTAMRTRPLTEEELASRQQAAEKHLRSGIDRALQTLRQQVPESARADFDEIAERLRKGDVGEGRVETGRRVKSVHARGKVAETLSQTAAQVSALLSEHGALDNTAREALAEADARAAAIAMTTAQREQRATHAPQTVRSDFLNEARQLESSSGKPYWTTPWELFARAFQSYVIDRLADRQARNDYLSRPQMDEAGVQASKALGLERGDRYPRGAERNRINSAFDTLIGELKTREGNNGNVALFSRSDRPEVTAEDRAAQVRARRQLRGVTADSTAAELKVAIERQEAIKARLRDLPAVEHPPAAVAPDFKVAQNIAEFWRALSTRKGVSLFGSVPEGVTGLQDIADAVAPGYQFTLDDKADAKGIRHGTLTTPNGRTGTFELERDGALQLHISGLEQGEAEGRALYMMFNTWAARNGYRALPDRGGITPVNAYRRTQMMAASALRDGGTAHLMPADNQRLPHWRAGDFGKAPTDAEQRFNTGYLFLKGAGQAMNTVPLLDRVRFNFQTGQFEDTKGREFTNADFNALLSQLAAGKVGVGLSTAKRAVLTASALRELQGRGLDQSHAAGQRLRDDAAGAGSELFGDDAGELGQQSSLDKLLYSRDANGAAARAPERRTDSTPAALTKTPPTGGVSRSGLGIDRALRLKKQLTANWGENAPRIVLVQSAEELQQAAGLPRDVLKDPDFYRSEGVYRGRPTVWLNVAAIKDEQRFAEVLAHEALGHFGVERVLGKEWKPIADVIDQHRRAGSGAEDLRRAIARVEKTQPAEVLADRELFAKEVIAVMAEQGARNGVMQRVLAAVQRFLRKLMPSRAWSVTEIRDLLNQSESFLRAGRTNAEAQATARAYAFSKRDQAPVFHSALVNAVETAKGAPKKADAEAWKGWLDGAQRRGEFKQAERDWLGLDDWLAKQDGPVTREQLADFVRANQVQVQDVVLDGGDLLAKNLPEGWFTEHVGPDDWAVLNEDNEAMGEGATEEDAIANAQDPDERSDAIRNGAAKFGQYQLPGGENYRELLLTLPGQRRGISELNTKEIARYGDLWNARARSDKLTDDELAELHGYEVRIGSRTDESAPQFQSSHFDQPNILVHVRSNERTDADGKKVLFLEEIQSDWHQQGRKQGYGSRKTLTDADVRAAADVSEGFWNTLSERERNVMRREMEGAGVTGGVPDAPFKGTDEWAMLAFKRMVRWAAERGFDRIAWTTGEQQAERYDLSKRIRDVTYAPETRVLIAKDLGGNNVIYQTDVAPEKVADYIGKEPAERLLADTPRKRYGDPIATQQVSGDGLKVGGEGMRGFYDSILPKAVNKWAKRFGAKVGTTSFDTKVSTRMAEAHSIEITPAMREAALAGQPLFSKGELHIDGRGEQRIELGGETFLKRGDRFYMVNGTGQPKDFLNLGAATEAAKRTGGEVRQDDAVEGQRPTWSVVVPEAEAKELTVKSALFSRAPAEVIDTIENEIRQVDADVEGDRSILGRARAALASAVPKKVKDQTRSAWLGALALRHLIELGSDYFPTMKIYGDYLKEMEAARNQLQQEGEDVAEAARKWAGKNMAEAGRTFDLMHDATILGVDPAEEYKPLQFNYSGKLVEVNKKNVKEALAAIREQARGRSGDNKTDLFAEAKGLRAMLAAEPKRKASYPGLVARWNQLSDTAKQQYVAMRDLYAKRSHETEEALVQRIKDLRMEGGENHKRMLINRIRQQFESQRLQGVYFPLQRFGRYFVAAEKDGTPTFQMYESLNDLEKAVKALRGRGFTIKAQGLKQEGQAKDAPSGTFVAEVIAQLQKSGVSTKTQDEIYQIYLQALPELSMRKHSIHRKSIIGFDTDALRAFAFNMTHGAHQLARLRYAHKLADTIEVLQGQQDAKRAEGEGDTRKIAAGDAVLEELRKRHAWISNPTDSKLTNLVTSFGFSYYLGLTPAAALVNLSQTALISFPYLAARHGPAKAMNQLLSTMSASARTLGHIQRTLTDPDELRAHQALQNMGALDKTQTHNLAGIAEGGLAGYNPKYAKAMEIIGWGFHKTEVVNREATGIAAFRLARAEGKTFDEAVRLAADAIHDTHYDYSNTNRARYMQSGTAKVLLMFRQYSLNTTWHLGRMVWNATKGADPDVKRIARRNLTGILGMSALFSGALGLPLASVTMGVLNAIASSFGDDDEPWDAETEFRAFLVDMFGEGPANVMLGGVANPITGADIASRVSLSQLWFRDADRELDGKGAYYNLLEQAAGPMGGVLKNALVGKQLMDEGHLMRGVETVLPKALKDSLKSMRYAREGVNNLRGDAIVPDLSLRQTLLQLGGFTPSEVADRYDRNRALKNYESAILDRRQYLMDAMAMAVRTGDQDGRRDALTQIRAFNRKYREIAITPASLRRSLQSRARYSKQAENGIFLNPKIAARVRAAVDGGGD